MGKIINSINNTGKGFVGKIVTVYRLVFLGHPSLAIQVKIMPSVTQNNAKNVFQNHNIHNIYFLHVSASD
jgi:hypothetical protein